MVAPIIHYLVGIKTNTANFVFFIIFMSREFRHDARRFCVLPGTNYYRKGLKISFKAKIRTSQGREIDEP